jgi:hypothetical protein
MATTSCERNPADPKSINGSREKRWKRAGGRADKKAARKADEKAVKKDKRQSVTA